VVRYRI